MFKSLGGLNIMDRRALTSTPKNFYSRDWLTKNYKCEKQFLSEHKVVTCMNTFYPQK